MTRLAVRLLAAFALATGLWALGIGVLYDRAIASVGIALLRALERPAMTEGARFSHPYTFIVRRPPYDRLGEQRLELRTHHNNMPLLVALLVATPGIAPRRRFRVVVVGCMVLSLTHLLSFMLAVQWAYTWANVGPYRVTDPAYYSRGFWQSLDHPAKLLKIVVRRTYAFHFSLGRMMLPVFLWLLLCWRPLRETAGPTRAATR